MDLSRPLPPAVLTVTLDRLIDNLTQLKQRYGGDLPAYLEVGPVPEHGIVTIAHSIFVPRRDGLEFSGDGAQRAHVRIQGASWT